MYIWEVPAWVITHLVSCIWEVVGPWELESRGWENSIDKAPKNPLVHFK